MRALTHVLDALVVLAFAAVGRSSHAEGLTLAGILDTAWPFLVALLLGRLVARALGATPPSIRAWGVLWPVTVAGGMLLRWVTGDGTALPFVFVATGVLGVGLLSWRLVAAMVMARSAQ